MLMLLVYYMLDTDNFLNAININLDMPNREYGECTEFFIPAVPKKDHVPSELEKKIQKDLKLVEKSDL